MNDHTNGSENNEASISEGSENQRPYRVQLEAQVLVSIEVYARSVGEARAKAFSWTGDYPSGVSVVGDYYVGENEEPDCDLGEMYWNIENGPLKTSSMWSNSNKERPIRASNPLLANR